MEGWWIIRLAVNAVALYAAIYIVPGLHGSVVNENWVTYVILGLIFGLVNVSSHSQIAHLPLLSPHPGSLQPDR